MRLFVEGLFIKISGVTSEEDALFAVGLGATAVGFEFAPGPRQVGVDMVRDTLKRLPYGAVSVGIFRQELPQRVVEVANTLGLTAVQIEGPTSLEQLRYVADRVNTVIRTVPSSAAIDDALASAGVDYVLTPESDDHSSLVDSLAVYEHPGRTPVIASGGLTPSNVADVVQNYPVFGVDVRAGVESTPGVKDAVRLGDFIARARWAYDNSAVPRGDDFFAP
ncbi:MAG TPA: phosphoribosylanthranilate isomerase [Acidimicrobiales bacterium]|nr:phosphoribosylanthranilate isomerase [Acidimicrobiales bacterium]